ncbi:MAG: Uma2 family endonuclease [Leptolyngbyaceae cyanobacterium]
MAQSITPNFPLAATYPDSDGQPMADNTKQFHWIVVIKDNLERLFAQDPAVFVAGDLLWYPLEGKPTVRQAPDVMVVFGRSKGDRGSYQQWREGDIAPQVVFEILSPGNRFGEVLRKLNFYDRHGVEEYYIYNPDTFELTGLVRSEQALTLLDAVEGWGSPRLWIRFELTPEGLVIYRPDGEQFSWPAQLSYSLGNRDSFKIPPPPLKNVTVPPKSRNSGGLHALVPPRVGGLGGPKHPAMKQRPVPQNSTLTGRQLQQRVETLETKLRELGVDPESL